MAENVIEFWSVSPCPLVSVACYIEEIAMEISVCGSVVCCIHLFISPNCCIGLFIVPDNFSGD